MSLFLMLSFTADAQDEEPIYTITSLMKVKQGDGDKYLQVEQDYWKPIHQELVKQGKILGWYLYSVQYTGSGDEYNYATVTHYRGSSNFNNFNIDLVSKVHPDKKWEDISRETTESRDLVTTKMLQWQLQSFPAEQRDPSKLVVVNYMKIPQGMAGEFGALRRDYVKPAFDHLVMEGKSEGWGMWSVMFPSGADVPYDAVSADFYNDFDNIGTNGLYPLIRELNKDKDMDALMQRMNATRIATKRELWQLVDYAR
jgi:hypothetical protein